MSVSLKTSHDQKRITANPLDPQHRVTMAVCSRIAVLRTDELDHQTRLETHDVADECTDRNLPAEPEPTEITPTEVPPQEDFSFGHVSAQCPRSLRERVPVDRHHGIVARP